MDQNSEKSHYEASLFLPAVFPMVFTKCLGWYSERRGGAEKWREIHLRHSGISYNRGYWCPGEQRTFLRESKPSQSIQHPSSGGLGQVSGEKSSSEIKKARGRTENGNSLVAQRPDT